MNLQGASAVELNSAAKRPPADVRPKATIAFNQQRDPVPRGQALPRTDLLFLKAREREPIDDLLVLSE
jgi:hypothetical protein